MEKIKSGSANLTFSDCLVSFPRLRLPGRALFVSRSGGAAILVTLGNLALHTTVYSLILFSYLFSCAVIFFQSYDLGKCFL